MHAILRPGTTALPALLLPTAPCCEARGSPTDR